MVRKIRFFSPIDSVSFESTLRRRVRRGGQELQGGGRVRIPKKTTLAKPRGERIKGSSWGIDWTIGQVRETEPPQVTKGEAMWLVRLTMGSPG